MHDDYRDPQRLARLVNLCLALFFITDVLFTASAIYKVVSINAFLDGAADLAILESSDTMGAVTAGILLTVWVVTAILICCWIYRANKNAQPFDDAALMTVSPKWNVGYFFVPFANLLMPFRGLAQTFQVSVDPHAPADVAVPVVMRIWWGCWLFAGALGNISFRLSLHADSLEQLRLASVLDIISFVPDMAATAALAWLVRTIADHQRANLAPLAALPADLAPAD